MESSNDARDDARKQAPGNKGDSRRVPVKECIGMGCVAAALVMVMTFVFTHAYESSKAIMLVLIYTAVTLVAVSGIAILLNWIAAGEAPHDPSKPRLD